MQWRGGKRRVGLGGGLPWIQRCVRLLRCERKGGGHDESCECVVILVI